MTTATVPPTRPFDADRLTQEMIEQIAGSDRLTEQLKRTVERHARSLIHSTLHEPARLWELWAGLCELAFAAGVEVLHPRREQIAASLGLKEETVRRGIDLAERMEVLLGHPLEGAEHLSAAKEQLRQFRTTVLDRWQSADDLAEMLVEKFPLTSAQLDELAKRSPPPQSWYNEEFDPFTPNAPE